MIFYDVQAEDAGAALAMPKNEDLVLAVNRLKSLQKLYLFEQKGGENYLGWTFWDAQEHHSHPSEGPVSLRWKLEDSEISFLIVFI